MKDKILYLILGMLIGAVITAGGFLIFSKNSEPRMNGKRPDFTYMEGNPDFIEREGKRDFSDREKRQRPEDDNFIPEEKITTESNEIDAE